MEHLLKEACGPWSKCTEFCLSGMSTLHPNVLCPDEVAHAMIECPYPRPRSSKMVCSCTDTTNKIPQLRHSGRCHRMEHSLCRSCTCLLTIDTVDKPVRQQLSCPLQAMTGTWICHGYMSQSRCCSQLKSYLLSLQARSTVPAGRMSCMISLSQNRFNSGCCCAQVVIICLARALPILCT